MNFATLPYFGIVVDAVWYPTNYIFSLNSSMGFIHSYKSGYIMNDY